MFAYFFTVAGLYVLPEWRTKGSEYWRTGCDHQITLLDGLYIRKKKSIATKSQELEKSNNYKDIPVYVKMAFIIYNFLSILGNGQVS